MSGGNLGNLDRIEVLFDSGSGSRLLRTYMRGRYSVVRMSQLTNGMMIAASNVFVRTLQLHSLQKQCVTPELRCSNKHPIDTTTHIV